MLTGLIACLLRPTASLFLVMNVVNFGVGLFLLSVGYAVTEASALGAILSFAVTSTQADRYIDGLREVLTDLAKMSTFVWNSIGYGMVIYGFLGILATVLNSKTLYFLHANVMMTSLFVWLIVVVTVGQITKGDYFMSILTAVFILELQLRYDTNPATTDPVSQLVNAIQVLLQCCGVGSHEEFEWAIFNNTNHLIPLSCCHVNQTAYWTHRYFDTSDPTCQEYPSANNSFIQYPCYDKLEEAMTAKSTFFMMIILGGTMWAVALILLSSYLLY